MSEIFALTTRDRGSFLLPGLLLISLFIHLFPLWLFREPLTHVNTKYIELTLEQTYEPSQVEIPEPELKPFEPLHIQEPLPTIINQEKPKVDSPPPTVTDFTDVPFPDITNLSPPKVVSFATKRAVPVKPKPSAEEQQRVYFQEIRKKINRYKTYPALARQKREKGEIAISFTLHQNGTVANVRAIDGVPSEALKRAAEDAVRRAAPFSAIPPSLSESSIVVRLTIRFKLKRS